MDLHPFIPFTFFFATALTFVLFYKATCHSKIILFSMFFWLILHSVLAYTGYYLNIDTMPPRIIIALIPPLLLMLVLFTTTKGKKWINQLNLKVLALLHIVRVPVELVLWWLFLNGAVPELMTFEGRNFDVLAGLTAPFVYYFGFVKKIMDRKIIVLWNVLSLALLLNIVVNALLSAPLPFQQFAHEQPNIAIVYFPFILLPAFVVPIVLFSHLATIKRFLSKTTKVYQ